MSDILFGQSYYLKFDPKLWQAMQPYPPLGTLYAASVARQQGYSVALFDAMLAESEAAWGAALAQHQPRYAIIYEDSFNYLSKMCLLAMRDAAFAMIEMAYPTLPLGFFGAKLVPNREDLTFPRSIWKFFHQIIPSQIQVRSEDYLHFGIRGHYKAEYHHKELLFPIPAFQNLQ